MSRQLVQTIVPTDWAPKGSGDARVRWLQNVVDLLNRVTTNRVSVVTTTTTVACSGAIQSTGVGTGQLTPKRYAEAWAQASASFKISAAGTLYVYLYRTAGSVPANGSAPNAGDIVVGGVAFAGPATVAGQDVSGSLSFIDTGLSETQAYRYYFAVKGTASTTATLEAGSQIQVSEF